ncbi:unnamed protein product [Allacma fusca]|uniref:G-protein coupled receptors family 1 profile domain-containing protein n=1 Tax=Allacma fusca TaxID=39272 RepID=A0A8J2LNQ1_9HEXA|nr:unnamed protein product [Allacma fusca]
MKSKTKFCLGNLAFANLCVGIFCIFQNLSLYLMDSWIFGEAMCKMYHFINSLSHTASILILVVISVERYFVILHPFKFRRFLTIQKLRLTIFAVWIISAIICSPRLYYIVTITHLLPRKKGERQKYEVICSIGSSLFDSKMSDLIYFVLLFLVPLLIISTLYAKIGFFLNKSQILPLQNFQEQIWTSLSIPEEEVPQESIRLLEMSNRMSQVGKFKTIPNNLFSTKFGSKFKNIFTSGQIKSQTDQNQILDPATTNNNNSRRNSTHSSGSSLRSHSQSNPTSRTPSRIFKRQIP